MLIPKPNQILIENDGSTMVPGIYKILFGTQADFISLRNEQGAIKIGGSDRELVNQLYNMDMFFLENHQTGTGVFEGYKYTPTTFDYSNINTSSYRGLHDPWIESGKTYVFRPSIIKNWRLDSNFKLKQSNFEDYLSKTGRVILEVTEKKGEETRIVRFELADSSSQFNQLTPKFSVGEDIVFLDNSTEPYHNDNEDEMLILSQSGVYLSKWSNFEGGIHMEKAGTRYSLTITSKDNWKLDETHSISIDGSGDWDAVSYSVHFGKMPGTNAFELMSADRIQFRNFGITDPTDCAPFLAGDELTIDTSFKKRVLLNGVSFLDDIEQGSTFHKFPAGQSLVQVVTSIGANVESIQLEIEEQEI